MLTTNFTPGPSQLYFTVADHARKAFRDGIPSLSHRSKQFESICREATEGLQHLLAVPPGYHIFFLSSATEIWERIIQNLVIEKSHHFINGSFSKKFFEIAQQLHRHPSKTEVNEGQGFTELSVDETELIALTHNETSTGVSLPLDFIHSFKARYPSALIAVDAVSSLPYPAFNYQLIDSVYFSVQKAFGLPAGLGVWLANDRCVEKAESILAAGHSIGSFHSLPSLLSHSKKFQTPETPNVLAIYLLSKVVEDMNRRGIEIIRRETEYKAALLYNTLEQHPLLNPFVKQVEFRSRTVIVASCGDLIKPLTSYLGSKGLQPGDGYGTFKSSQLRFANFPAHSREQYELLVDSLAAFQG